MGDPTEDRKEADELPDGDVLAILYRQHADISEALDRVSESSGEERKANFDAIVAFLKAHETAEQEVIRPVVETESSSPDEAQLRNDEESEADAAIQELLGLDVDSDEFDTKFEAFKTAVADHAEREEHEEFPLIQARPDSEREKLGEAFLEAETAATA